MAAGLRLSPSRRAEPQSSEEQAERWVAELDKYGIERIGFVTGRDNDELARVVAMYPDRFIGFAHHDITQPGCRRRSWSAPSPSLA